MSDKFVPNFAAFRLYEDGTESGSSPIEDQDTDTTGRLIDSDSQVHLRVRIDETGSGTIAGETTDDWTLEYRLNGGGSWITITTSSSAVQVDTGSSLTDDGATTDRGTNGISAGTGTFFAGVQEDGDGIITDFQHEGDNHTEHVFAILLISAVLVDTDALTFRVALNGSNIAAGVTPSITVATGGSTFNESIALDQAMSLAPTATLTMPTSILLDQAMEIAVAAGLAFNEAIVLDAAYEIVTAATRDINPSILLDAAYEITPTATLTINPSILLDTAYRIDPTAALIVPASIVLDQAMALEMIVGLNFEEAITLDAAYSIDNTTTLSFNEAITLTLAESLGINTVVVMAPSINLDTGYSMEIANTAEFSNSIELNLKASWTLTDLSIAGGATPTVYKIYQRRRRH